MAALTKDGSGDAFSGRQVSGFIIGHRADAQLKTNV